MSGRNERVSLMSSQDGGTVSKSSGVCSPAVAVPPQAFYLNSGVNSSARYGVSNYAPVIRGLPYKQHLAAAGDYQCDQRFHVRDLKDYALQQPQRPVIVGQSSVSAHDTASTMYDHRSSPYHLHRPSVAVTTESACAAKRPRLMSDFAQPLRIDVDVRRSHQVGSSAYKPQVEAISPTLPVDNALENQIRHSRDELVQNIHRVDREITNMDHTVEKLKRKQRELEEEAKKPAEERTSEPEVVVDMKNQSIVQTIHIDNRRKADSSHSKLSKHGQATPLPIYVQPSDTVVHKTNKEHFAEFKKHLIAYLKKQKRATKIRENYWAEKYEKLLQSWAKKLEKIENGAKRRARDAKMREVFEKVFPELKKQREDKDRLLRVTSTRPTAYARSEANVMQIVDGLHEQAQEERKMQSLAVIPPMLLDERQKKLRFVNNNGLLDDPKAASDESLSKTHYWTDTEKDSFRGRFLHRPKNFGYIASALHNKSAEDCVLFYYLSKKSANYKQMVRRQHAPPPRTRKPKTYRPTATQLVHEVKDEKIGDGEMMLEFSEDKKLSSDSDVYEKTDDSDEEQDEADAADVAAGIRSASDVDVLPVRHAVMLKGIQDADMNVVHPGLARTSGGQTDAHEGRILPGTVVRGDGTSHSGTVNCESLPECPLNPRSVQSSSAAPEVSLIQSLRQPLYCSSRPTAADTVEAIIAREILANGEAVSTAAVWKKCDPWTSGIPEMNCARKWPTAADTIDAIIGREVGLNSDGMSGGTGWKKVGSRTSVCSDNTSDTLSADEGQRDDDETRPRQVRAEDIAANSVGGTVIPSVIDHARNDSGPPGLPTSSATGSNMGISSAFFRQPGNGPQVPQTKELLVSLTNRLSSSQSPDARHTLANSNNQPVLPASSVVASVLGRGAQTLRVRDVIHSAIEENLQSSNSASSSLDNLWQLYSQNRGLLPGARSAATADTPNESAQDLSCRNREPQLAATKAPPAPANCVGPLGVVGLLRAEKSPPLAHSHYGRPPVAVMQPPPPIVDRRQDPLYHLAEVASQRGRVEVSGDRHRASPTPGAAAGYSGQLVLRPSIHPSELDRSDGSMSAAHAGGSITLGTPRHLMAGDVLSKSHSDVGHRNPSQHAPKVNNSLATAQDDLRYLRQPDTSQRAVMERVMSRVAPSNPSHNILMGDYVTAQQMQTSQYQQSSQHYQYHQPLDHRTGVHDHMSSPCNPDLLDGMRIIRSVTDVQSRPQFPERPQNPCRSLTAANVIDAIITHQINKEAPVSGTSAGTVLNRLPDPQVLSNSHRVMNVNGSIQPGGSVSSTDAGKVVYTPRHSIAERLEKERCNAANSYPAVPFRSQEMSKSTASSASVGQLPRPVTLGEHIDKMIQKDFSTSINDSPPPTVVDVPRNGATDDTKNALRTFLTSSNDFSSNGAARQRESMVPVARSMSSLVPGVTVTSGAHNSPLPVPASSVSLRPVRDSAEVRSASNTAGFAGHFLPAGHVESTTALQKSPRQSAPCLPAAAIFPNINDIARFSISSTGHPPLAVPFLVTRTPSVEPGIHGRQIFGTLGMTSMPQPSSSLSSIVLPAGFVAGSALRLPLGPVQQAISVVTTTNPLLHGHTAGRSPVSSQAVGTNDDPVIARVEHSDHQDVSSAMNWKLKMARDHQRQEQERSTEKLNVSCSVNEATPPNAVVRVTSDAGQPASASSVTATATSSEAPPTRPLIPFGQSWLSGSISRDGSSDAGSASSVSGSPRSPRTGSGQPEKTMSAIAATHQTMTSLLSKPRCIDFPVDKVVTVEGSADNTSMTPTPPVPSASGSDAAPAIVSEVVPPTSPVLSDVKCNAVPVNQSSPSPQPPGQISPTDRPAEAAEPPQLVVETEAQDAGLTDRTRSPSPSNDVVTSEQRSTEAESRSQLPDAMDDTTASVPVSESS